MDVPHEEMDVEPEGTRVIDLMARLEESLKRPRGGARRKAPEAAPVAESRAAGATASRPRRRREPAKTRTTKRKSA